MYASRLVPGTRSVTVLLLAVCCAYGGGSEGGADVAVGDTREQVLSVLGQPSGAMQTRGEQVLLYDRGTVVLRNGKVVEVKLVSAEEAAQIAARRREEAAARQLAAEEAKQKRMQQGMDEKARTLANPSFATRPPAERLTYWRQFAARYPGVAVGAEIAQAQADLRAEHEEKNRERIDELTAEIADIETQIADAQRIISNPNVWSSVTKRKRTELRRLREQLSALQEELRALQSPPEAAGP